MALISKNKYIDKLGEMVNNCNNTYHRTIKMKPVNINSSTCIDFNKENNKELEKFKVGDHVRISKYKKKSVKGYTRNWSEDVFVLKKFINTAVDLCY